MANKKLNKLLEKHQNLIHSTEQKVISHVQREQDEWFINTVMIENIDTPFKYKRKQPYKSLTGQLVNLTYYASQEEVAGFSMDIFSVVRVKVA